MRQSIFNSDLREKIEKPIGTDKIIISASITKQQEQYLDELKQATGYPKSHIIRIALEQFFNSLNHRGN